MSEHPIRLQLSRRKGANLQARSIEANGLFAVNVARPGKHGNPYYPGCGIGFGGFDENMQPVHWPLRTAADFVRHFREYMRLMRRDEPEKFEALVAPLRGKNCACWCKLDAPYCHADVWIELANPKKEAAAA